MIFRRKKKVAKIDTSMEGYKYLGIDFTDQQYQDICTVNTLMRGDEQGIPVHYIIITLKILGLLPIKEGDDNLIDVVAEKTEKIWNEEFQKKFGRIKEL